MSVSVINVLSILLLKFQSYGDPPKHPSNPTRKEHKIANHFSSLLQQIIADEVDIEEDEELVINEDEDYEEYQFDVEKLYFSSANDGYEYPKDQLVQFSSDFVTKEQVQEAIKFYRHSSKKKSRPLKSMNNRFRWIKTSYDIRKLLNIASLGDNFHGDRLQSLRVLAFKLFELVKSKFDKGISLHDADVKKLAIDMNKKDFHIKNFEASDSWITRWKKKFRIVSRKITTFTTRKCIIDKTEILARGEKFVDQFKLEMNNYLPSQIFNADQTGIQKELYSARALAIMGDKIIERIAQAKASLTHSFTFLPMLFQNGTMGPKAFVVFSEQDGVFPPTKPIPTTPNLVVIPGKSHMMNKVMMCQWLKGCVFEPGVPKKLLMLVDSWPSFRDHQTIQSCVPPGYDLKVMNIPPLCTSQIQPLDKYWNMPWKNLIKKFTSYALVHRPEYVIAKRNNLIRMTSLLYFQISSKEFQNFLQYSWKATGYTDVHNPFITPAQKCFGSVGDSDCYLPSCSTSAFIRCARCNEVICFEHFIVDAQHYCPFL